jgi:uncharacterized membrane protein HdeD (DUF308 family)
MARAFAENWWALALRGVLAILFGIAVLVWPSLSLLTLVLLFGSYAVVDGIFALITAFRRREQRNWWLLLLEGAAGIAAGVLTWLYPGITALILLFFIAFQAIITGGFEIAAAWRLREEIKGEWLLALAGIASIAFGVLMILFPGGGALAVLALIAAYAIVFGITMIILAFRFRGMEDELPPSGQPGTTATA